MSIETEGIVIKSRKYGEADAILTVLSYKMGMIKVFARASKKLKSPLLSGTQVFSHSDFSLFPSRDAYTLQSADLIRNYYRLSSNFDKFSYGSYFLEFAQSVLAENQPAREYFILLKDMLNLMTDQNPDLEKLRIFYELRALEYIGLKPVVSKCVNCGIIELGNQWKFSISEGGLICSSCLQQGMNVFTLDPSSLRLIRFFYDNSLQDAMETKVSPLLIGEIRQLLDRYLKFFLGDQKLKSIELINNFKEV